MSDLETIRGVGPSTSRKLRDAAFTDVASVADAEPARLAEITGFQLSRAAAIRDAARELLSSAPDERPPRKVRKLQKRARKLRKRADRARAAGKKRKAKKADKAADKTEAKAAKKLGRTPTDEDVAPP